MRILDEKTIRSSIDIQKAYESQREAFIAHSQGRTIGSISQVHIGLGSLHVKSGMINGSPQLFTKLATGFSDNWKRGLPTGDGCILGFSSTSGLLETLLLDRGYLTDLRTALAARVCIEEFGPKKTTSIGILGTGVQARLCAEQQFYATQCRNLRVWGRNPERVQTFKTEMEAKSFQVNVLHSPESLLQECEIVITTTSSREPLLKKTDHSLTRLIIALGADEAGKQELDPQLVASADLLVADDPNQSSLIGEFQHAVRMNFITPESIHSLGELLSLQNRTSRHFTICDLSGLPVQDSQISSLVANH